MSAPNQIRMSFDRKIAVKLLSALQKGTFNKLTKAEADAIEDLVCNLDIEVNCYERT